MSIKTQRGLSLIEILVFMVIVSVGLSGMLSTFQVTLQRSADPLIQRQMLAVAESLLDEILTRDFAPAADSFVPSSKACDTFRVERAQYDDVADYDGVTDCPVYSLADNTAVAGLEAYRVSITAASASGLNGLNSAEAIKVIVTLRQADQSLTLQGWRTNYGS